MIPWASLGRRICLGCGLWVVLGLVGLIGCQKEKTPTLDKAQQASNSSTGKLGGALGHASQVPSKPGGRVVAVAPPATSRPSSRSSSTSNSLKGVVGRISRQGWIDCFPAGFRKKKRKKKLAYCETSAVVFDGKRVWMATDKQVRGKERSSVFSSLFPKESWTASSFRYLEKSKLFGIRKIEDMTISPDRSMIWMMSGFDRIRTKDRKWDKYNRLLAWKVADQPDVMWLPDSKRETLAQPIPLRQAIAQALKNDAFPKGMPYYKVEGLAALPGNRLLFGVRALGATYKSFAYAVKLLMASWAWKEGQIRIGAVREVYDFTTRAKTQVGRIVGLSSLEYDPHAKAIWMLTSYEENETARGLGAYLWKLTLDDIQTNRPAILVRTTQGKPLLFAHKAEAVTVMGKGHLLVFHDDDRVVGSLPVRDPVHEFHRLPHQAAYSFVRIGHKH